MTTTDTIERVYVCELVPPVESVTLIVKVDDPAAVGVPEIPPPLLNARPAGRAPAATVQV
jgi:hypothetical protein